jgi:hypothetical protein
MMLWINHYWRITDLCYHVNYATPVLNLGFCRNCHDRDRMVVGFTSIHATHKVVSLTIGRVDVIKFISRCIAVSGYSIMSNHYILTFWTELKICMLDIKQTINQSIKTNHRHDITELLLKVVLSTDFSILLSIDLKMV